MRPYPIKENRHSSVKSGRPTPAPNRRGSTLLLLPRTVDNGASGTATGMEDDMRELKILLAGLLILGTSAGCGFRERRWGWCAVGGGLVGAAVGAGTAGGLVNAYEKGRTREETGAAAGGGAVGGALLGTLIGHALCDPMEEAPPP